MRRLTAYQREALRFCVREQCGALFMEMRLGKTLVAIRYARFSQVEKALVVAPGSALGSWQDELELEGETYKLLLGPARKRLEALNEHARWYLINKEGHRALPEIEDVQWDLVVLDESSQMIRYPKTLVTKFYLNGFTNVPRRLVLTGTPDPEGPLDLFCQMKFCLGTFLGCSNFYEFRQRYFVEDVRGFGWVPKKGTTEKIQAALTEHAFLLRRRDVGKEVPKRVETRSLELPGSLRKEYRRLEKDFEAEFDGKRYSYMYQLQTWVKLRQLSSGILPDGSVGWTGKLDELVSLLKGELRGTKPVIWVCFLASMHAIVKSLRNAKIPCSAIWGDVPMEQRNAVKKQWDESEGRCLICQVQTSRSGVNLSSSDTAIYYELPAALLDYKQSRDRILNTERKSPLLYVNLVTKGTIDEDLKTALWVKGARSDQEIAATIERGLKTGR